MQGCDQQFSGGERIDKSILWEEYLRGKPTYLQLAKKYNCSKRTIQRKIDSHKLAVESKEPRDIIVSMDTTYWGRSLGVMLSKDAITRENLLKY
jgi:hypothetical protein